jgi:cation diffusion facilitator CzcD-associated flavoprotein CzcO
VELYEYFKGRAVAYGVEEYTKLNHKVNAARWDDDAGKWVVEVTDLQSGLTISDQAEVLINGAGFLK